jgi:hypothetical protein
MAQGHWSQAHVRRLFWRAGFGATPREARRFAREGKEATIDWLLNGERGGRELRGSPSRVDGKRIDPLNVWGHDTLWWLDRMVRTRRPLDEKMTLFWSDHFATTDQETPLMLRQNRMLRAGGLGSFRKLLGDVTRDPAMQLFLSLADSDKRAPNENFARELMELFTLGGGYTEKDVRHAARALTGWEAKWGKSGFRGIRFNDDHHDEGIKTLLGRSGRFGTGDVLDIVVAHRRHAPYLTRKLWDFFITRPPDRATAARLARVYRGSRHRIKPVVAEILAHPALYADLDAPDMVKSPLVFVAGHLRTAGGKVDREAWAWLLGEMGQQPFRPPSVAGWNWGPAWLTTNSMRARFVAVNYLLDERRGSLPVRNGAGDPDVSSSPAVDAALASLGHPWVSSATRERLVGLAHRWYADMTKPWQVKQRPDRADMLQRALRHLILSGPDAHLH